MASLLLSGLSAHVDTGNVLLNKTNYVYLWEAEAGSSQRGMMVGHSHHVCWCYMSNIFFLSILGHLANRNICFHSNCPEIREVWSDLSPGGNVHVCVLDMYVNFRFQL